MCTGLPAVLCQLDCTDRVFGNENETEYTEATDTMVYLNLNDPAKCYGTLSSYQFCHYPMTTGTYNAFLAVFRRQGDTYVPLMESEASLQVTVAQAFNCSTSVPVGPGSVQIEPGDVVGVCLGPLQGSRKQLNLVGNNATGFSVSGVSMTGICNIKNIQMSATVTISELMNLTDSVLHLSAEFCELIVHIITRCS